MNTHNLRRMKSDRLGEGCRIPLIPHLNCMTEEQPRLIQMSDIRLAQCNLSISDNLSLPEPDFVDIQAVLNQDWQYQ
ncbi:hypothetical protein SS50377_21362 [Spironucleus salmonicida]|uniref:Uncharacterized protein n=1 Tax=Spironucleus salmonicida TaxID=348837 RepID=V6LTW5_9EUKA|nr:hypothetical protein SS50377_21362 [Spironucleus salmonicida]|eukprot:EST44214.1 Hypothetical protein SS50377_15937 [Spironucleus salmonicida]